MLLLLISNGPGKPVYYCPACETAWESLPREVNKALTLDVVAPDGTRFANLEEAKRISNGHFRPVSYAAWAGQLGGIAIPMES
jgi:hypothetical protein